VCLRQAVGCVLNAVDCRPNTDFPRTSIPFPRSASQITVGMRSSSQWETCRGSPRSGKSTSL
jgi:hypothetical protein